MWTMLEVFVLALVGHINDTKQTGVYNMACHKRTAAILHLVTTPSDYTYLGGGVKYIMIHTPASMQLYGVKGACLFPV